MKSEAQVIPTLHPGLQPDECYSGCYIRVDDVDGNLLKFGKVL